MVIYSVTLKLAELTPPLSVFSGKNLVALDSYLGKNEFREIYPKDTANKNIIRSANVNSIRCAKFCTFDLFHYLSNVSNNDLYQNKKKS